MSESERFAPLIDPTLLDGLTNEQKQEALAAAAAARRAEERADQRALEHAVARKRAERAELDQRNGQISSSVSNNSNSDAVKYVPKRQRTAPPPDHANNGGSNHNGNKSNASSRPMVSSNSNDSRVVARASAAQSFAVAASSALSSKEREYVKQNYLGKTSQELAANKQQAKPPPKQQTGSIKGKMTFKFKWDDTDDTLDTSDPLYAGPPVAAVGTITAPPAAARKRHVINGTRRVDHQSVAAKPIGTMTARDWRIFRENYQIHVRGGQAPPPLRRFDETTTVPIHDALLDAIQQVLRFREPSPIQRQAIPMGLQRRDLIGLAETGSGKTIAFGVPLCHYLLNLPPDVLRNVARSGPLALVLAPTRELALQIQGEIEKLLSQQNIVTSTAVVGGQSLQAQAQALRAGVHLVVGTPGRLNECLEMAYLVLNQCSYIVLDECDRMVDMGFLPQLESILDAMGGALKSEDEATTYQQEQEDLKTNAVARHRLTAMFSATMPPEVEHIAKRYLRHPAIVSIGDQDTVKNARITQHVVFLASPGQKEKALRDLLLHPRWMREKVIVFVNEKKYADGVGRMVEKMGRPCVVLHGGKAQDQRETYLASFRQGGVVMVATDVAARGLDIPDVAHVINYDLPSRSIESYTHRIGRTGRAGKEGVATSFLTDEDEMIMPALKAYLESTGQRVPEKLARHSAVGSSMGQSNVIH